MNIRLLIFFMVLPFVSLAQFTYDIKNPKVNYRNNCEECLNVLERKPPEVQMSVQKDGVGNIFFVVNNEAWLDELLRDPDDGIAVDIISKDQYVCNGPNRFANSWASIGHLQPPVYKPELYKSKIKARNGLTAMRIGTIPPDMMNKELEFNLLILKNRFLCHYNKFMNIQQVKWDLLDMGLYMDTIVYKSRMDTSKNLRSGFSQQTKQMKFIVPFEKNKSVYKPKDVKPIYDSLRLNEFEIKSLEILAYSSAEGPTERNIQLQNERGQSIVDVLQSFQDLKIKASVHASENWVEFFADIVNTPFVAMGALAKPNIKEKLKEPEIATAIEPILAKHRKAILLVELGKKYASMNYPPEKLVQLFKSAVESNNVKDATELQQVIFSKIAGNKLPFEFINSVNVPERSELSVLLNNQSAFRFLVDKEDLSETYKDFKRLEQLNPQDARVKYNLCALKFRLWLQGKEQVNPLQFKHEIEDLKTYHIPQKLINRMLLNYHIIMSEQYMEKHDYKNKDISLAYIYNSFKGAPMKEDDLLSLAEYFVGYMKYDWAGQMLTPYAKRIDVGEDLLFYYLNLTINNESIAKTYSYRLILLNAVNRNKARFCKMLNANSAGGVSFQLLDNDLVKRISCESCN